MGSFCEIVMSFPLREDVGPDVLAAFASIAVSHRDAPPLPPAVREDPVAAHLDAGDRLTGFFVGYARHEAEPRPWLLWADGERLFAEDLNPPGFLL